MQMKVLKKNKNYNYSVVSPWNLKQIVQYSNCIKKKKTSNVETDNMFSHDSTISLVLPNFKEKCRNNKTVCNMPA